MMNLWCSVLARSMDWALDNGHLRVARVVELVSIYTSPAEW